MNRNKKIITSRILEKYLIALLLSIFVLLGFSVRSSYAAVTAWMSPSAIGEAGHNCYAGAYVSWTNHANVYTSNNSYASVTVAGGSGTKSYGFQITGFGFSIPAGSRIDGVEARVEGARPTADNYSLIASIKKNGFDIGSSCSYPTYAAEGWSSVESVRNFGAPSFSTVSWGVASGMAGYPLTAAQVNMSDFGIVLWVSPIPNAGTWNIDHVQMRVNYTAPPTASGISASYGSYTRTGPGNTPWTLNFTGAGGTTNYQVRTGSTSTTGTQVITGVATDGVNAKTIAYNATGIVQGTNTLYLYLSPDGSFWSPSYSFTLLRDDSVTAPSAISHTPNPVIADNQYSVTFTDADTYSTSANEMLYQVRTAAAGGGSLVASGNFTQGSARTTGIFTDSTLAGGSNTRYLRIRDGANNWNETLFTVVKSGFPSISSPTKASISYTTVTLGGNVTSDNGYTVTNRGVCYAPTVTDSTPQIGDPGVTCVSTTGTTGIFTIDVSGLTHNTAYSYEAYATNSQGTSYTSPDTFTTLTIQPPAIVVQAPTNPTATSITLNATANPNSSATTAYFRVWPYSPLNCLDAGGTRYPEGGGTALSGAVAQAFSENITNLVSQKTYYYCAIATNTGGTNYHSGTPSSFTTPSGPQTNCDPSPNSAFVTPATPDCSFPGSGNITGMDGAALTVSSGTTLTIKQGQTIVFSTISKPTGGVINKSGIGAVMRKGYIWVKDSDGDGLYDPYSVTYSPDGTTPPGAGYVRRSALGGASYLSQAAECNDSSSTVTAATCEPGATAPNGVTNLTSTAATLNGITNPNGDAGTLGYFKWGSTNTGDCDTLASSTSASLLSGTTNQGYTANISGLSNLTTYYWCTIVYNNAGTSYGNISSFVAQNGPPTIALGSPSSSGATATTATLNLDITSNGGSAITSRGSCWDTVDGLQGINCANEGGTTTGTYAHARSGFTSGTKVYFRGRAINALGTSYSSVDSFVTAPTLAVNSNTVFNRSDLSWNSTTGATGYYIKWCKDAACTPNSTGSAFGEINVGNVTSYQHSHGNTCGAVMRYIVYATVSGGYSAESTVQEVTTLCPPTINTISADSSSQLTVNYTPAGSVTGNEVYRCTPSASCGDPTSLITTDNATSPYANSGLSINTGYAYRLKGVSANAKSDYSNRMAQTTLNSAPPSVTTNAASSITTTTATLNSTVNPNSAATTVYYRYGTSNVACSSLPTQVTHGAIGSGSTNVSPNAYSLSSLSQGTTYYYCAYAVNSQGTTYGNVVSFTTLVFPQDLFTDANGTLLENHTMNRGAGWTKLIDVGTGNLVISSNTLYTSAALTSSGELYQTNDTIYTANYRVFATMTTGDSADDYSVLAGRIQDANNMYAAKFNNTDSSLWKKVGGTWTQLGSTGAGIADGSIVSLNLNGTGIALVDDGIEVIGATDSAISAAGKAGVGLGGVITSTDDFSIQVLDSFEVGTAYSCTNGYRDLDGDGYGTGVNGCYIGASAVNTDCYDSNSSARPNQTSYFWTGHRGDGSWDYDCSNGTVDIQASSTGYRTDIACDSPNSGPSFADRWNGSSCNSSTSYSGSTCGPTHAVVAPADCGVNSMINDATTTIRFYGYSGAASCTGGAYTWSGVLRWECR